MAEKSKIMTTPKTEEKKAPEYYADGMPVLYHSGVALSMIEARVSRRQTKQWAGLAKRHLSTWPTARERARYKT